MFRIFLVSIVTILFAALVGTGTLPNGYILNGSKTIPKQFKVSIINEETALSLFKDFANDISIPYKYPIDGCYARATAMTRIAERKGIIMGRINIEGNLQVMTQLPKFGLVQWGWHVAPILLVKDSRGNVNKMVFDPSLFDEPVSEEIWLKKMLFKTSQYDPSIREVYYGNRNQYFMKSFSPIPVRYREEYRSKPPKGKDFSDLPPESVLFSYRSMQDFSFETKKSLDQDSKGFRNGVN